MGNRLDGRVAIVTGGSGGIGAASARLFWEEGASVMLVDLKSAALDETANQISPIGERIAVFAADLVDESLAAEAVGETVDRFGKLDVLANVAAVRVYGPVTEATGESWDRIVGVNLRAVANCCKYAIPLMAAGGGGTIVNVSSSNANVGRAGMAQYDATKSALLALTRSMACDHAGERIRVNTVSPGPTLTPFHVRNRAAKTGESLAEAEAAMRAAGAPNTLLGRQAEPIEIAYAILFLAGPESSYVTGANFSIDGGLSGLRS
ncbi:MAG: SDR family oxidoreductase [Chloroflexia bacterium]|nr:SDR family oxidoreductase [Chloroflexia bacterium]